MQEKNPIELVITREQIGNKRLDLYPVKIEIYPETFTIFMERVGGSEYPTPIRSFYKIPINELWESINDLLAFFKEAENWKQFYRKCEVRSAERYVKKLIGSLESADKDKLEELGSAVMNGTDCQYSIEAENGMWRIKFS